VVNQRRYAGLYGVRIEFYKTNPAAVLHDGRRGAGDFGHIGIEKRGLGNR
jgi:hypothetical protein